jgi:hypothetical protein
MNAKKQKLMAELEAYREANLDTWERYTRDLNAEELTLFHERFRRAVMILTTPDAFEPVLRGVRLMLAFDVVLEKQGRRCREWTSRT